MDAVSLRQAPLHPGRRDKDMVLARPSQRLHRYDRVRPSPGAGGLLRETGRAIRAEAASRRLGFWLGSYL